MQQKSNTNKGAINPGQQIQNSIEKEKQKRPWREEQLKGVNQCNGVLCKEIQKLWHRIELKFGSLLGSN